MRWWTLLVLLLLAGCANEGTQETTTTGPLPGEDLGGGGVQPGPPPEEAANYTAHRFDGGADLVVSHVQAGLLSLYLNDQNCALLHPDFSAVTNLTVTATFASDLPTDLTLFVRGDRSGTAGPGASPLTVSIDKMGAGEIWFGVHANPGTVEQQVKLDVGFDYVGADRLVLEPGYSC